MNRFLAMSLIAVTGLCVSVQAQPKLTGKTVSAAAADSVFNLTGAGSVELSAPFGPGDRSARIKINLLPGETTGNVEYWVLYSDDKSLLTGAHIGSDFPQGKAKLDVSQSNGEVYATFYFPHAKHPKPNVKDVRATQYGPDKTVYFQWVKRKGSTTVESPIVEFVMPDQFTIANMGDSYAAGEGAPNASGSKWQNERAHRSGNSGQALAVKEFRENNPGVAVAFINVASSGAGVTKGIIQSQTKKGLFESELHASIIPPQIDQVRDWMKQNKHDTMNVILLSIGINEIGFADLVSGYFIAPGNLVDDKVARGRIDNDIKELKADYQAVKEAFDRSFDYDKVIVSQYPDPTHGKKGNLCGKLGDVLGYGSCWGAVEVLSGDGEFRIAHAAGQAMNDRIKSVVEGFAGSQWVIGGDAAEKTKGHGLCNCDEPWFNTIGASLKVQGDFDGTWHPNRAGHRELVKPIIAHDLKVAYLKFAKEYAKDQAKEAAKEAAKKKILARQKLAQKTVLKASEHDAGGEKATTISAEARKKALESSKQLPPPPPGEDNNEGDDK